MRRVLATKQALSAPQPMFSYIERRMLECINAVVYFEDLGSVHQVAYLLEKTTSLISLNERALRPNYEWTCAYFSSELQLMHKLVNLYTESTKLLSTRPTGKDADSGQFRIAPVKLPSNVVQACLDLIANFRRMALRADPLIFDLSQNNFGDEYMKKAAQLVKLCSINLKVLKLDGNFLSH